MTIRSLKSSSSIRSTSNALSASAPTVPSAPTIGIVTTSGTSATVPFTASTSNGGSPIVTYTAVSSPGNISATVVQSGSGTITVNGLSASTSYTFTVYATNSVGNSANSDSSNSITTAGETLPNYGLTATGGTITEFSYSNATYRTHTFTASGAFVVSSLGSLYNTIELCVVGSGTGGVTSLAGGAGGQVLYYGSESTNYFSRVAAIAGSALTGIQVATYTVTIGAGGANRASGATVTSAGTSFIGTGISVTANGGRIVLSSQSKTYTISGNGFQSGDAGSASVPCGGAGASGPGSVWSTTIYHGGRGGPGMYFTTLGIPANFGGGGALGINSGYGSNQTRSRGEGGGYSGGRGDEAGVANTGGGGGGGWNGSASKNGGSGVVVVKYRIR